MFRQREFEALEGPSATDQGSVYQEVKKNIVDVESDEASNWMI